MAIALHTYEQRAVATATVTDILTWVPLDLQIMACGIRCGRQCVDMIRISARNERARDTL